MSPALTDLMAGNVQMLIVSLPSVHAQMKSGRLRALGVTSAKRTTFMPELPAYFRLENNYAQQWMMGYRPMVFSSYWKYLDIDTSKRK